MSTNKLTEKELTRFNEKLEQISSDKLDLIESKLKIRELETKDILIQRLNTRVTFYASIVIAIMTVLSFFGYNTVINALTADIKKDLLIDLDKDFRNEIEKYAIKIENEVDKIQIKSDQLTKELNDSESELKNEADKARNQINEARVKMKIAQNTTDRSIKELDKVEGTLAKMKVISEEFTVLKSSGEQKLNEINSQFSAYQDTIGNAVNEVLQLSNQTRNQIQTLALSLDPSSPYIEDVNEFYESDVPILSITGKNFESKEGLVKIVYSNLLEVLFNENVQRVESEEIPVIHSWTYDEIQLIIPSSSHMRNDSDFVMDRIELITDSGVLAKY